jgi:hypothetical protein
MLPQKYSSKQKDKEKKKERRKEREKMKGKRQEDKKEAKKKQTSGNKPNTTQFFFLYHRNAISWLDINALSCMKLAINILTARRAVHQMRRLSIQILVWKRNMRGATILFS